MRAVKREWMKRIRCGSALVERLPKWKNCYQPKQRKPGRQTLHKGIEDASATSPAHDKKLHELIDQQQCNDEGERDELRSPEDARKGSSMR